MLVPKRTENQQDRSNNRSKRNGLSFQIVVFQYLLFPHVQIDPPGATSDEAAKRPKAKQT